MKKIIKIEDKEYKLDYNLNAMIDIQKRYGSLEEAFKKVREMEIEAIRFFLMVGINQGMDMELTEQDTGKLLDLGNINKVSLDMMKAMGS